MTDHYCMQEMRLRRHEDEEARREARRVEDMKLTAKSSKAVASQFRDGVERMNEATELVKDVAIRMGEVCKRLDMQERATRALFARIDRLAAKLGGV